MNRLVVYDLTHIHEPFLGECGLLGLECIKTLKKTHVELGFFRGHCGVALELGRKSIKQLLLRIVAYPMRAIAYETWASRLWWLFLVLQFSLPHLVVRRLFLPSVLAVVALVLATLSPTFVLVRPFALVSDFAVAMTSSSI